jgi:branched-chain amino acid aminotransferase
MGKIGVFLEVGFDFYGFPVQSLQFRNPEAGSRRFMHRGGSAMQVEVTRAEKLKAKPDENKLGFGTIFTDHMFNMDYNPEKGWHNPRIEPYAPLVMEPSTMVLHYGQGVFEGLKAYRNRQGGVQLFRPQENFKRLNASNRKLCIPEVDEAFALDALKQLLRLEKEWVPGASGTSLYIRPTIIATDPFLGVRASHTYRFFIILSPVGAYYPEGFNPVKIMVTTDHVRAVRGGVGDTKTMGNYAASLFAGEVAHKAGYTQVLWLDGVELKYLEEVGAMNIFFVIDDELITPMLTGSILPGITRDSVLALGRSWGLKAVEKKISIDEVIDAHASGHLKEIFGSGTAAVISPVSELKYGDTVITVGDGGVGPLAHKFFQAIQDIQYGAIDGPPGWVEPV